MEILRQRHEYRVEDESAAVSWYTPPTLEAVRGPLSQAAYLADQLSFCYGFASIALRRLLVLRGIYNAKSSFPEHLQRGLE